MVTVGIHCRTVGVLSETVGVLSEYCRSTVGVLSEYCRKLLSDQCRTRAQSNIILISLVSGGPRDLISEPLYRALQLC